jgi:hypothetical protein
MLLIVLKSSISSCLFKKNNVASRQAEIIANNILFLDFLVNDIFLKESKN